MPGSTIIRMVALAGVALGACGSSAAGRNGPAYLDPALPPEARAADLVHRMTLEEKASQLVNHARAIPRLRVPAYDWWSEALHGVLAKDTTVFPEPIGLAATFDPEGRQMRINPDAHIIADADAVAGVDEACVQHTSPANLGAHGPPDKGC